MEWFPPSISTWRLGGNCDVTHRAVPITQSLAAAATYLLTYSLALDTVNESAKTTVLRNRFTAETRKPEQSYRYACTTLRPYVKPRHFMCSAKNRRGGLGGRCSQELPPPKKNSAVNFGPERRAIMHVQKRNRLSDVDEILHSGRDSDDRLWGLGVAGSQILLFCLYVRRRSYKHFTTTVLRVDKAHKHSTSVQTKIEMRFCRATAFHNALNVLCRLQAQLSWNAICCMLHSLSWA